MKQQDKEISIKEFGQKVADFWKRHGLDGAVQRNHEMAFENFQKMKGGNRL